MKSETSSASIDLPSSKHLETVHLPPYATSHGSADIEKVTVLEQQDALPTVDGGKDAWLFLAGCFIFEALIWGKYILFFLTCIADVNEVDHSQDFPSRTAFFRNSTPLIPHFQTIRTG
jgi:hypothetical protein